MRGRAVFHTRAGSWAASRPHPKACRFASTATAFRRMAASIDSAASGTSPFWYANPTMKRLVAIESPRRAVARVVASTKSTISRPAMSWIWRAMSRDPRSMVLSMTNAAGGVTSPLTTAREEPWSMVARLSGAAAVTMSQPRRSRTAPAPMRVACRSSARSATRTWLATAPFFWERPVESSTVTPLPSTWAAIPRSAPMVMTPVPPMPVTRIP